MSSTSETIGSIHDVHRAFIQALFAHQILSHTQLKHLLAAILSAHTPNRPTLPNDVTEPDIDEAIQRVNDSLSAFDFELRSAQPQQTASAITRPSSTSNHISDDALPPADPSERHYALVNTTSDAPTQLATHRRPDELAFIRRLLDAIFDTYNTRRAEVLAVKVPAALDLRRPPAGDEGDGLTQTGATQGGGAAGVGKDLGLSFQAAEKVLDDLVVEKWFELSGKGYYSLAPRGLMELKGWLVEIYNDGMEDEDDDDDDDDDEARRYEKIKFCAVCRDIVTVGQRCPDTRCLCRLHHTCVTISVRAQGGREICPTCKIEWKDPGMVGEKAARRADRERQSSGLRNGHSNARRSVINDGADDEEEG